MTLSIEDLEKLFRVPTDSKAVSDLVRDLMKNWKAKVEDTPRSEATAEEKASERLWEDLVNVSGRLADLADKVETLKNVINSEVVNRAKAIEELTEELETYRTLNNSAHTKIRDDLHGEIAQAWQDHEGLHHGAFRQTMTGDANVLPTDSTDGSGGWEAGGHKWDFAAKSPWEFQVGDTWTHKNPYIPNPKPEFLTAIKVAGAGVWVSDTVLDRAEPAQRGVWADANYWRDNGSNFKRGEAPTDEAPTSPPEPQATGSKKWEYKSGDFVKVKWEDGPTEWLWLEKPFEFLKAWVTKTKRGRVTVLGDAWLDKHAVEYHRAAPEGWEA